MMLEEWPKNFKYVIVNKHVEQTTPAQVHFERSHLVGTMYLQMVKWYHRGVLYDLQTLALPKYKSFTYLYILKMKTVCKQLHNLSCSKSFHTY